MTDKQCSLSVVVVNYNALDLLKHCIENLLDLSLNFSFEIIVVDNASQDGSRDWLKEEDQRITSIFLLKNQGFAGGCNAGITKSTGDYILLLNTDAFPTMEALTTLMTYLEHHPRVGIVGPQLLYADKTWQPSSGMYPSPKTAFLGALGLVSGMHGICRLLWPATHQWWWSRPVEYIDGACMLIRRAVIDKIGLFDENFFFFVEDAEFCHRAREHGWLTYYVPQSQVIHLRGGSSSQKNFEKSTIMQLTSRKIFIERVYGHKGWNRTTFWTAINYWIRGCFCHILENSLKCEKYRLLKEIYWKEYLTSRSAENR